MGTVLQSCLDGFRHPADDEVLSEIAHNSTAVLSRRQNFLPIRQFFVLAAKLFVRSASMVEKAGFPD